MGAVTITIHSIQTITDKISANVSSALEFLMRDPNTGIDHIHRHTGPLSPLLL